MLLWIGNIVAMVEFTTYNQVNILRRASAGKTLVFSVRHALIGGVISLIIISMYHFQQ